MILLGANLFDKIISYFVLLDDIMVDMIDSARRDFGGGYPDRRDFD